MINLIIPLTKRKISLKEIFEIVKSSKYKKEIFVRVLCEKNNSILQEKIKSNCSIDVFPINTSEDSMIFSTIKNLDVDEVVIVRNGCRFFTTGAIDKLIDSGKNNKDIVMFKQNKNKNKIKNWFSTLFQKICGKFFNFNFFDGDLGCMYFSARAHNILQETNVTAMTKINRWACVEIEYLEEDIPKSKICEKIPKSIPLKLVMYVGILACLIIGTIFFAKTGNLKMLYIILIVCFITSVVCMIVYMVLKWICFRKIGEIHSKKTEILERRADG